MVNLKKCLKTKKGKIIFGVATLIVILAAGYLGLSFYAKSLYTNTFKQFNDSTAKTLADSIKIKDEMNLFTQNITKMQNSYDIDELETLANDSARIIDQQTSAMKEYCDKFDSDYFQTSTIPTGFITVFLNSEQNENLKKLKQLVNDSYASDTKSCDNIDGIAEVGIFSIEMYKSAAYIGLGSDDNYANPEPISNLAKFADKSYKIEHMDQIVALYGEPTETFIDAYIRMVASFYISYEAVQEYKEELSQSSYDDYVNLNSQISALATSASSATDEIQKKDGAKSLKITKEIYNLVKSVNTSAKETNYSQELWDGVLIYSALSQYGNYADDTYPVYSSVNSLIEKLKELKYLDGANISYSEIKYVADDEDSYKITIKDKINNQTYVIEEVTY